MEKLVFDYIPLFKIKIGGMPELVGQSTIDFYTKWWTQKKLEVIEELGEVKLDGVEVYLLGTSKSNCYRAASYKVISDKPLGDFELDVLRANKLFLGGQETGKLVSKTLEEGKHVYNLRSVCDSSD